MAENTSAVDYPVAAYLEMSAAWEPLDDLLTETVGMRTKPRWLPIKAKEAADVYRSRLGGAFLYGAYKDTLSKTVARPFAQSVVVRGKELLPEMLAPIPDNVDRDGTDLTTFLREVMWEAMHRGLCHVLVERPRQVVDERTGEPNHSIDKTGDVRPYFVKVSAQQLVGWRTRKNAAGVDALAMVRILEHRTEPDGDYGEVEVDYVRVLIAPENGEAGRWELWRKLKGAEDYELHEQGPSGFDGIPLRTYYINRTGLLTAKPPLSELGWLNLEHWESLANHRHVLGFQRHGILFARGISSGEMDGFVSAPSVFLKTTNESASLSYVEPSGEAISAGERDIERIEMRMRALGLQPLVERTAQETATGKEIDESRSQNNLQAWTRSLETFARTLFETAAEWERVELHDDVDIDIFSDFAVSSRAATELDTLLKARLSGEISRETYLQELKRRGVLAESVDVASELEAAEADVALGLLAQPAEDDDEDDDDAEDVADDEDDTEGD